MTHETALQLLDEVDSREDYGFGLRMHLARCPECSAVAKRVEAAMKAYREDLLPETIGNRVEDRVMDAVRLMPPPRQDFALRDWLFPGAALGLSMVLLPLVGSNVGFLGALFGPGYVVTLSLVLGALFTGYCAFVIATHLGELQAYLEKRGLMPR